MLKLWLSSHLHNAEECLLFLLSLLSTFLFNKPRKNSFDILFVKKHKIRVFAFGTNIALALVEEGNTLGGHPG